MGAEKVIKVSTLSRTVFTCDQSEVNEPTNSERKGSSPRDSRCRNRCMIQMDLRPMMEIWKSSEKIGMKVMDGMVVVEVDALLKSYWEAILFSLSSTTA